MSRERWQELDEQAPPGPWVEHEAAVWTVDADRVLTDIVAECGRDDDLSATFIAAARTGWPAAERECEQLRAERDQVLALLRAVRGELGSWINSTEASDALRLIDTSGLLDDEGQQQPR